MNPRLLEYYNRELNYLREQGSEFAAHYPKVASRLGMHGIDIADPYVERLLEGFGFLTARIQMKMDAEFPRFSQRLLEIIYPNYLAPTPAMCIVQFAPDDMTSIPGGNFRIHRGERLEAPSILPGHPGCRFRTAHDVELLPLRLGKARMSGVPNDLEHHSRQYKVPIKIALLLDFSATASSGAGISPPDRLSLYLNGSPHIASHLYELLCGHTVGVAVRAKGHGQHAWRHLPERALHPEGFSEEEALLPYTSRGFQGYRLLHEYFTFPNRFYFVAIEGLKNALGDEQITGFEIAILLERESHELEMAIDRNHFALFCTPAVNLISMRTDRIPMADNQFEFHIVPDRAQPLSYEVYHVEAVEGFSKNNTAATEFRPFYTNVVGDRGNHGAYFSVRREPRLPSESMERQGARTTYRGSEVFLSLVNQHDAPYGTNLSEFGVSIVATNRDLPLLMTAGSEYDFSVADTIPVRSVKILAGPTTPVSASAENELTWRLISHLGLTYQTLIDPDPDAGAQAMRELLALYTSLGDPAIACHANAILTTAISPIVRRLPGIGPLTYGRGVRIDLSIDESQFAGISPYLLGSVLEQFLARHVSLNTFTEMRLISAQRGQIEHWPTRFKSGSMS
jgi:type VI secretion system protein ImpG